MRLSIGTRPRADATLPPVEATPSEADQRRHHRDARDENGRENKYSVCEFIGRVGSGHLPPPVRSLGALQALTQDRKRRASRCGLREARGLQVGRSGGRVVLECDEKPRRAPRPQWAVERKRSSRSKVEMIPTRRSESVTRMWWSLFS